MSLSYKQLWESGQLTELAKRFSKIADLAGFLGLTEDALETGIRRLRRKDPTIPLLSTMLNSPSNGPKLPVDIQSKTDDQKGFREWHGSQLPNRAVSYTSGPLPPRMTIPTPTTDALLNIFDSDEDPPNLYSPGLEWAEEGVTQPSVEPYGDAQNNTGEEPESEPDILEPVEEHRLKRKLRDLESRNKYLLDQIASAQDRFSILTEAMDHRIDPIECTSREHGKREGTAVFLVSDLHLEEDVVPEKVNYMNKFNLEIARRRMTRLFEGMRWFIETQRQTFDITTACIWLGGDMYSNYLHEDNVECNNLPPPAAWAFAKQLLSDGIKHVLEDDQLTKIVFPCNDGNHGRISKDLRASSRAEMSMETMMYGMLADEFRHDKRVQFEIAQGDHLYTQIYDWTFRWTHGAEVKGGSGIGGIMVPIYRAMSRWQTVKHADVTCGGHFHQRISLHDLEMNGSLIGYNPYALRIAARFEEPAQSAFMVDSKRGKSISAPIWVSDAAEEKDL